jgi:DNA-binding NarL/FixJ family response regulator
VRDLVGAVLHLQGLVVEAPAAAAAPGTEADVVVLVAPTAAEWDVARRRGLPVVLVAERHLDPDELAEAVLRGVDAVVHTDAPPTDLPATVRAVARGETLIDPRATRRLADAARSGRARQPKLVLTGREVDILRSVERGESVKQTARSLGIAIKTVENLQSRLYRKLGAHNRAHAMTLAHHLGLLEPPTAPEGSPWPHAS